MCSLTRISNAQVPNVEVIPALREQEPVLSNLLELYCYDFSELLNLLLRPDGRFGYDRLPLYWTEPTRYPFLIWAGGELAGFALVQKGSQISGDEEVYDMAEFFVLRRYRRLGVGLKAAHLVWSRLPGKWEIRVITQNQNAVRFWERAVEEFAGRPSFPVTLDRNGKSWQVFSFESAR